MTELANNPYSAPEASLDRPQESQNLAGLKRFSTWGVLGLCIITLGIYSLYWLYSRTNQINNLTDNKIGNNFVIVASILYIASTVVAYLPFFGVLNSTLIMVSPFVSIGSMVIFYVWIYKLRNRLNQVTNSAGQVTWCGPILTFFLTIFYLNYKINQNIDIQNAKNS